MTSKDKLIPPYTMRNRILPPVMVDHAEVVIGDWAIYGRAQEVVEFEEYIGGIEAMTEDGEIARVFNFPKQSSNGRNLNIEVSKGYAGKVKQPACPIFGGTLTKAFGRGRVPRNAPEYIRLGLDASLNLNHFHIAQRFPKLFRLNRCHPRHPLALVMSQSEARYGSEFCLTGDTNVLVGPPALFIYACSKPVQDHFLDYISLVEGFLTSEFNRIADRTSGVRVEHVPYYAIRKIEFVWEFYHPNPIRLVENLVIPMRPLGGESRQHRALVRGERVRVKQSSLSVSTELTSECNLVVYAKTNERVRFEIRLKKEAITAILKKEGSAGRTARTHEGLRRMITILRDEATARMQQAMDALDRQRVPPASDVTTMQLCAEVGRILQDDKLAHTVLETLRMRGSLTGSHKSPVKEAAMKLTEAGILMRLVPRSQVFVPMDGYLRAVQGLRAL